MTDEPTDHPPVANAAHALCPPPRNRGQRHGARIRRRASRRSAATFRNCNTSGSRSTKPPVERGCKIWRLADHAVVPPLSFTLRRSDRPLPGPAVPRAAGRHAALGSRP